MEKQFKITDPTGVHARPASVLVQSITNFQSKIELIYNDRTVNLKSIMGVMSLGIPSGAVVTIQAEGTDAVEALSSIEKTLKDEQIGEPAS